MMSSDACAIRSSGTSLPPRSASSKSWLCQPNISPASVTGFAALASRAPNAAQPAASTGLSGAAMWGTIILPIPSVRAIPMAVSAAPSTMSSAKCADGIRRPAASSASFSAAGSSNSAP